MRDNGASFEFVDMMMMTMNDDGMRTIIELPDGQLDALSALCRKERISRAEAIRRAVGRLLEEKKTGAADEAFGVWKHKKLNARKHVEKMRAEWEK
jgi:metal-responsive CopG/Arc/MetJ family transcriptional regulator